MTVAAKENIEAIIIDEIKGVLLTQNDKTHTYVFSKLSALPPVFQMEVHISSSIITCFGWCHHEQALLETYHNMKPSPLFHVKSDPYLEDYQNLVLLLDDLHQRLILTEEDIIMSNLPKMNSSHIHEQAEMSNNPDVSDNLEDYYVSEVENRERYGSIGGVDLLGNLMQLLLRQYQEKTDTEYTAVSIERKNNSYTQLDEQTRERLDRRMRRFMQRFKQGLTSESYLNKIDSEIFIRNSVIYVEFLCKLQDCLGDDFLSKKQLIDELYDVTTTFCSISKKQVIPRDEETELLMVQALAAILAKNEILHEEDNLEFARSQRKIIGAHLKTIHQNVQSIRVNYSEYIPMLKKYIEHFGLRLTEAQIKKTFEERFPIITYTQFLKHLEKLDVLKAPLFTEPKLVLQTAVRLMKADFSMMQLSLLHAMLSVEEWENTSSFQITWHNSLPDSNLKRFILYYNKEKKILKRKYVYRNGIEPRIERKINVHHSKIEEAMEKGIPNVIMEGFRLVAGN